MAKAIDYLQTAIGGTRSITKALLAQFNSEIKNITASSVLFLLLSTFAYLLLCYLAAGLSERPRSVGRIIRNYLLVCVRTVLWVIFSIVLGTIYYTIIIEVAPIHAIIVRNVCCLIFVLVVYYGAIFSIPPDYL